MPGPVSCLQKLKTGKKALEGYEQNDTNGHIFCLWISTRAQTHPQIWIYVFRKMVSVHTVSKMTVNRLHE